jgi:hypothetical protein
MSQTFAMQTKVNRQWENLFAHNMRLREELGQYTGESSRVKALEAENAILKAKLDQAVEKAAKSDEDHRRASEEWLASCAKFNEDLKSRTKAYHRQKAEADLAGCQLLEKNAELEVMAKIVAAMEDDKDRLAAEVKRKNEDIFWLLGQGVAGAIQTFRSYFEYIEALAEFNITAEFVGRMEGFNDVLHYVVDGKSQAD